MNVSDFYDKNEKPREVIRWRGKKWSRTGGGVYLYYQHRNMELSLGSEVSGDYSVSLDIGMKNGAEPDIRIWGVGATIPGAFRALEKNINRVKNL